jgi:aminoglycoside phosphotransferase (APT) family kinase protein
MAVTAAPPELVDALAAMGVIDGAAPLPTMEPLTGGVSSDIWRIDLPSGSVVAKQALAQLKVAGDWRAPLSRTGYEVAWMRRAEAICPGVTPRIVASSGNAFVMAYLDPRRHRLWKRELLDGRADPAVAAAVGDRIVAIHAATANDPSVRVEFDNSDVFASLRLDPYFAAAADRHQDLATRLDAIRQSYLANRKALVHGDVSPKNILVGPDGPVLLDAECATWGDPAFDVAFCTTHLLLKMLVAAQATTRLRASLDALSDNYEHGLDWEDAATFWRRCVSTTTGLLLARVDGLSPVEYLDTGQQATVRHAARSLLIDPPPTVPELIERWITMIEARHHDRRSTE